MKRRKQEKNSQSPLPCPFWLDEAAHVEIRRQQPEPPVPEEFAFLDPPCPGENGEDWEQIAREHDEYMSRMFWTENVEWPLRHPMEDVVGGD